MTIGERIKTLRRKSDLTQEKLADYLGVSYQAVSKWENGISSPDLALIIPLAKLFGVTTDELLGMNSVESDARKAELEAAWKMTYNTGDLAKRYEVATTAATEFPGNMKFLWYLAEAEYYKAYDYEKDDERFITRIEKSLKHYQIIIEDCTDTEIRNSAISGVVLCLSVLGRRDEARKYAELLPNNNSCNRDELLKWCLSGDEAYRHNQKMLLRMVDDLMYHLENYIGGQYAYEAAEKILKIMIPDGNYLWFNIGLHRNYTKQARYRIKYGDLDGAVKLLEMAYAAASSADELWLSEKVHSYTTPFFDQLECDPKEFCVSGMSTEVDDMRGELKSHDFDPVRDRLTFMDRL